MKKIVQILILFCFLAGVVIAEDFISDNYDENSFSNSAPKKIERLSLNNHRIISIEKSNLSDNAQRIQDLDVDSYKDGHRSALRQQHSSFLGHFIFGKGDTWRERWKQYRAANKAEDLIKERQKEIRKKNVVFMNEEFIKNLKSYEIEVLQPWKIKELCESVFNQRLSLVKYPNGLSSKQEIYRITAFSPQQIKYFTPRQIQALDFNLMDIGQRQALVKNQIQALTAHQIQGEYKFDIKSGKDILIKRGISTLSLFTPEQISWFRPGQVALWTPGEIKSLDVLQIKAMTTEQLKELNIFELSDVQKSYFTHSQREELQKLNILFWTT
ncbi:hypothetical protein HYV10_03180 [Candidatus Dependentiae bacterium]|nr:hypothetical protein [Candidatus Dependentiae bacterium]